METELTAPLSQGNTLPGNIPRPLSSFVGRERELVQLQAHLLSEDSRLVTVAGTGGAGKTRLATEVSRVVSKTFKDGIWLVDLAPLSESPQLEQAIARVLGLPEKQPGSDLKTLVQYLNPKHILLVLDNCEHLVEACARLADALLKGCPGLRILATSRERLGVEGEIVLKLRPLTLPPSDRALSPAELSASEAVQLFVRRSQAVQPDFALTPENAEAVARICLRLDGLPLALELAAAHINSLGIAQIAARLDSRFPMLETANRLASLRQQTLQTMLDWSYNLLTERESVVFRRFGIFNGSVSLEAIENVCAGTYTLDSGAGTIGSTGILGLVLGLVNKSLIQAEPDQSQPGVFRYRLLETVRHYARLKLVEAGDMENRLVHQNLFAWCLQVAVAARVGLKGSEQSHWLQRLKQEHYFFSTSLKWALESERNNHPPFAKVVQLAIALAPYWQTHGHFVEGGQWFQAILAHPGMEKLTSEVRSETLHWAGVFFNPLDQNQARALHLQSLKLAEEQGDIAGQVKALTELGWQAYYQLEDEQGYQYVLQALDLANRLPEPGTRIGPLFLQAILAERLGKYEESARCGEECLQFWRGSRDRGSIASGLNVVAEAAIRLGEFGKARQYLLENIDMQKEIGSPIGTWICLSKVIKLGLASSISESGSPLPPATTARFAGWLGAVESAFIKIGGTPPPMTKKLFDELAQAVRDSMVAASFASAWEEGHNLPLAEALEQARHLLNTPFAAIEPPDSSAPSPTKAAKNLPHSSLTPRELEVLRLVARGLTNPEIARELSVTPRTVNAHLTSIYGKLNLASRGGAIRYALENHLA